MRISKGRDAALRHPSVRERAFNAFGRAVQRTDVFSVLPLRIAQRFNAGKIV
jgi:hypothetical protein